MRTRYIARDRRLQNRSARAVAAFNVQGRNRGSKKTRDLRNPPRISLRIALCPSFFFFLPSPPLHIIRVLLFSPFFFPSDVNSSLLLLLLLRVEVTLPARNATENVNVNFAAPLLFPSPTFVSTSSPVEHSDPTAIISTPSHRGKTKYSRPDRCRAIAAFYRQFLRRSVRFCEYPRSKREEKRGGGGGRNTGQLNAARFQKGGKKRKERGEKLKEGIEGRRKNRTRRKRGQGGVHQSVFRSVGRWFAFSVRETRLCYACSMHALSRGDAESATAAPRHAVYTRTRLSGVEGGGGRLGAMLICMRRHDGRRRSSGGCATLGAEGSEGKHRSLSPVHPLLAPLLSPLRHPAPLDATRHPHVSPSLSLSLPPSSSSSSSSPVSPRFSSLPSLYPSRCYLSLLLPRPRRGLFFLSLDDQRDV